MTFNSDRDSRCYTLPWSRKESPEPHPGASEAESERNIRFSFFFNAPLYLIWRPFYTWKALSTRENDCLPSRNSDPLWYPARIRLHPSSISANMSFSNGNYWMRQVRAILFALLLVCLVVFLSISRSLTYQVMTNGATTPSCNASDSIVYLELYLIDTLNVLFFETPVYQQCRVSGRVILQRLLDLDTSVATLGKGYEYTRWGR